MVVLTAKVDFKKIMLILGAAAVVLLALILIFGIFYLRNLNLVYYTTFSVNSQAFCRFFLTRFIRNILFLREYNIKRKGEITL